MSRDVHEVLQVRNKDDVYGCELVMFMYCDCPLLAQAV